MTRQRLHDLLSGFSEVSILVVGDFFLDRYLILDPALTETSLETGLDAYQVVDRRCSPGAAGTVTSNLHALGIGTIHAVGVIGEDGEGYELKRGLIATGVGTDGLIETPERFTPTYTKPMMREAGGEREINRIDIKNRSPLPAGVEEQVIAYLRDRTPAVNAVIIADQVQERNHGVITDRIRETLAALGRAYPQVFFLADSRAYIGAFREVIVKPNRREAAEAIEPGYNGVMDRTAAERWGRALYRRTRRPVYVTLSEEGLLLITDEGNVHIPGMPVSGPIDPVGAGDSTTAGLVSSLCAGATYEEAGLVGNLVASITIQQLGATGTASPAQVLRRFEEHLGASTP